MSWQCMEDFQGREAGLHDSLMVDTCQSAFVKAHGRHATDRDPGVTHELWALMLCHCTLAGCVCSPPWGGGQWPGRPCVGGGVGRI